MADGSTGLEVVFDRRYEEGRELGRAVDAQPGDLVAHTRVGEPPENGRRVLGSRVARNRCQRRHGLLVEQSLDEVPHLGSRHRLVDERDPGEGAEVRHAGVPGVEDPQLVQLPGVDVVGEQDADVFPSRPAHRRRRPRSTHCRNGSATTGQRSTMPSRASSAARSSSDVTGVIRSTIEFGKLQCDSIHVASPWATASAAESTTLRAASPLPGRLSQLRIVTGAVPVRLRCSRARARRSNVESVATSGA